MLCGVMGLCNFLLGLCVVGGVQVGPDKYMLQVMDIDQNIHNIMIHHQDHGEFSTKISEDTL